jgi:hypothetical protein
MPISEKTVASSALPRSSCPTAGPTISVPTRVKFPRFALRRAFSTCSAVEESAVPDSAPTVGTRIITWFFAGSPNELMIASAPPPGNPWSIACRTC